MALLASALVLVGCEFDDRQDESLRPSDPTAPAMVLFEQSTKALTAASGALIQALNLNEYLLAPDEESRLALEDRYYPYRKVREKSENVWHIYDDSYKEIYRLKDGECLTEADAKWEIISNPMFFDKDNDTKSVATIERTLEDQYKVVFEQTIVPFYPLKTNDFDTYLRSWGWQVASRMEVTIDLTIQTNNTAFRNGEEEQLVFTISGRGKIVDGYLSYPEDYAVEFKITEPVTLTFGDNAVITKDCAGSGAMTVTNGQIDVEAMMDRNVIAITLTTKGTPQKHYSGYYDWTGNHLQ